MRNAIRLVESQAMRETFRTGVHFLMIRFCNIHEIGEEISAIRRTEIPSSEFRYLLLLELRAIEAAFQIVNNDCRYTVLCLFQGSIVASRLFSAINGSNVDDDQQSLDNRGEENLRGFESAFLKSRIREVNRGNTTQKVQDTISNARIIVRTRHFHIWRVYFRETTVQNC
jgi:hypothetical protein